MGGRKYFGCRPEPVAISRQRKPRVLPAIFASLYKGGKSQAGAGFATIRIPLYGSHRFAAGYVCGRGTGGNRRGVRLEPDSAQFAAAADSFGGTTRRQRYERN